MTVTSDAVALLALPFAASVVFVLIHAYLGVHVLRRKVVFADLALAQLSALGASVAFANGYDVRSTAGFAYALAFTAIGAALLTFTRGLARTMSQEAIVGILYVVAMAATILVVDQSPLGAEHVKRILIGSILTVSAEDVAKLAALYAAIGAVHWFIRRPLLALSSDEPSAPYRSRAAAWSWDFVFFLSFGVVVTSSVTTAGVLLVFSLLIVPAVIGAAFSKRLGPVLAIAWGVGIAGCAAGLGGSYVFDLPTGATMVVALAASLVLAGAVKACIVVDAGVRRARLTTLARTTIVGGLLCVVASSTWLIVNPAGDQPLLAVLERAADVGPPAFLTRTEAETYESAVRDIVRFQREADRLDATERAARYQGAPLADDEIRRIASYQQNYNEMTRGERFVRDVLQAKARARERWIIGVPAAVVALAGLAFCLRWRRACDRSDVSAPSANRHDALAATSND
jgi:zinc/manganese transport system permease protein